MLQAERRIARRTRLLVVLLALALIPIIPGVDGDHSQTANGKTITFDHKTGNEWWVEVILKGPSASSVTRVEAKDDGGPWVPLTFHHWGAWGKSFHIEPGHRVQFRAIWSDATVTSCWFTHPAGLEQCGGTPPPPPPTGPQKEAENFATKTAGGRQADGGASGGALWNLWSNGHIQDTLTATATSDLVVRAGGTPAAGWDPVMSITVNGVERSKGPVTSWAYNNYIVEDIPAGTHTIRISFTNDYRNAHEDRNLLLDVVKFVPPGSSGDPPPPPSIGPATLVAGGLSFPVDITFGPDGTLYFAEVASGNYRAIPPGSNTPTAPLGHVDALPGGNGGFLGLLADKDFANTNAFYVYYSHEKPDGSRENRVSRMVDGVETIILDGIPYGHEHDGGRLAWMGDHLLVATGEAQDFSIPMDPNSLGGKILRITTDGDAAPGNPTPGNRMYSMGHRNPFGLAYDPVANIIWSSENGPEHNDEVNIILPGKNYGWPAGSGKLNNPSYEDPVVAINPTIGPTGGTVLDGKFYFGSFNDASVYRVDGSPGSYSATRIWSLEWFHRVLEVQAGPDGALYVGTYDAIYRLPVGEGGGDPPPDLPPLVPSAREAEAFATKTAGGKQSQGGASGGAIWNLWSNGYIEDQMQSDGIHPLVIMAAGDNANGWPHAKVWLDGVMVWEFDATSTSIKAYEGPVPCQGMHTVRIQFTNDYYAPPADRNLRLDKVFFGDKPGDPAHEHPPENICPG